MKYIQVNNEEKPELHKSKNTFIRKFIHIFNSTMQEK
jgi:hypothetical protein